MPSLTLDALTASPNALAAHYSRFRVGQRLLLTGHSHQAWPDCSEHGVVQAFADAAELVDEKWGRAIARADRVRAGYADLLTDTSGWIALGSNTHELIVRFLSALPWAQRPRLISTDGEFHTLRRQLDRLSEEKFLQVIRVPAYPAATLAQRLRAELDRDGSRTAAVMLSSVLFGSAHIVPGLAELASACTHHGAELLVDAYHHLNVVPFAVRDQGLEQAFITGGGYKYCQLGEGNCFLRFPRSCTLRPIITGWYSEFSLLERTQQPGRLGYGEGPDRFAGATYDPTSHYRAAEVFEFFARMGLTPEFLRTVSQHQVGLLMRRFDDADLDPRLIRRDRSVPLSGIAGFLGLHSPQAEALHHALRTRGVLTDFRGDVLRLGPAPYLSDDQLNAAMDALLDAAGQLSQSH